MNNKLKKQLIIHGYLSEHLPPFFTSEGLYNSYDNLIAKVIRSDRGYYDCATFTMAKNNHDRRLIKVPNPAKQLTLIKYILENQSTVEDVFNKNEHTLSNPFYYTPGRYGGLVQFDLPKLRDDKKGNVKSTFLANLQTKMDKSLGYQFCYKLDIANFYDSIYTHSIEWGITGREKAKKGEGRPNLGSELDKLVRETNSKETSGIPTGPFTSRIISEIILYAIDQELEILSNEYDQIYQFTHYVDDYEFYFRNESDIYYVKNKIIEIFNSYRLMINEQKTSIESYPFHNLVDIKREYDFYMYLYKKSQDEKYVRILFFKADDLEKDGVTGAYKYLYKMLDDYKNIDLSESWTIVEPFLIGHLLIQPSLSQYIVKVILLYKEFITKNFIKELYINLEMSLKKHLHNESHWLLWALLKINYEFSAEELSNLLKETDDDLTKIMLIHTIYINGFQNKEYILGLLENEITRLEELSFQSEHWMLIHEWFINQWKDYKRLQDRKSVV